MSLLNDAMETCVFITKQRVSDGEGGFSYNYVEGVDFECAIAFDNSLQARTAGKAGVTSLYTVTTKKGVHLEYHELFKRLRDSKVFRVTSDYDDKETPSMASFQYEQVSAEEWKLV